MTCDLSKKILKSLVQKELARSILVYTMSVLVQVMTSHDPCQASPFILHRDVSIDSKLTDGHFDQSRVQRSALDAFLAQQKKKLSKMDKFWPLKKNKLGSG